MRHLRGKKAFTLIELLIVIAIIGLIGSIAAVGLASSRTKSRDAKRLADLGQIVKGLQLAYTQYGSYPSTTPVTLGSATAKVLCALGSTVKWASDTSAANCDSSKIYMQGVSTDPLSTGSYVYKTTNPASTFSICTTLEKGVDFSGNKYQGSPMVVVADPTAIKNAAACP